MDKAFSLSEATAEARSNADMQIANETASLLARAEASEDDGNVSASQHEQLAWRYACTRSRTWVLDMKGCGMKAGAGMPMSAWDGIVARASVLRIR